MANTPPGAYGGNEQRPRRLPRGPSPSSVWGLRSRAAARTPYPRHSARCLTACPLLLQDRALTTRFALPSVSRRPLIPTGTTCSSSPTMLRRRVSSSSSTSAMPMSKCRQSCAMHEASRHVLVLSVDSIGSRACHRNRSALTRLDSSPSAISISPGLIKLTPQGTPPVNNRSRAFRATQAPC